MGKGNCDGGGGGKGNSVQEGVCEEEGKEIILVQVLEGKCKKEQEEMEVKEMNG